jgi:hypothetical protein
MKMAAPVSSATETPKIETAFRISSIANETMTG